MDDTGRKVILVDRRDNQTGSLEKLRAHREGKLHRAFSVFIFNSKGELLVQRRARSKYHSGGLIANTCCSHPAPGDGTLSSAVKRLKEEMGIKAPLSEIFSFIYKARLGNGLVEHELDHVLVGYYSGAARPNRSEVDKAYWMALPSLREDMKARPESYAYWFREIILKHYDELASRSQGSDDGSGAGPSCPPMGCPLCSPAGIFLIIIGLLLYFLLPRSLSWLGLIPVLLAYILPLARSSRR